MTQSEPTHKATTAYIQQRSTAAIFPSYTKSPKVITERLSHINTHPQVAAGITEYGFMAGTRKRAKTMQKRFINLKRELIEQGRNGNNNESSIVVS